MGKRLPTTPRSKVRSALRQLWLRSRERAAALKRDGYRCGMCGKKQSKAKGKEFAVEVHHCRGIQWDHVIDEIFEHILVDPKYLQTLCPKDHEKRKEV